jgi:hypothetical protein
MLTMSETEHKVGYYGNADLYMRLIRFNADTMTLAQQVIFQLPSEFSNYIIVKLDAFLTKTNFTINCALGEWLSVYMDTRTRLNAKQNFTSKPSGASLVVWLYYVKS